MESVQWKVEGMSCTNCALSIHKYLKNSGIEEPKVNFMEGDVAFELPDEIQKETLVKGIEKLGYKVKGQQEKQNRIKPIFCLFIIYNLVPQIIQSMFCSTINYF